jgi:hypothetical protein
MKILLFSLALFFISNRSAAAIPDTSQHPLPDKGSLIMKHYHNAETLNLAGFVMLGGGLVFGTLAVIEFAIEATAFAVTLPVSILTGEEQKTSTTKFGEHFLVSVFLLAASIPFFIAGSVQKNKARRLSVFSEKRTTSSFYQPSNQFNNLTDFNVGIKIRIGK